VRCRGRFLWHSWASMKSFVPKDSRKPRSGKGAGESGSGGRNAERRPHHQAKGARELDRADHPKLMGCSARNRLTFDRTNSVTVWFRS
jgi:hypothetical protein